MALVALLAGSVMAAAALAGGPVTTIDSPGPLINDSTPTFTWHSNQVVSGYLCQLDDGDSVACGCGAPRKLARGCGQPGAYTSFALADGSHRFRVEPTGPNSSVAQLNFVVDTVAPETEMTSEPTDVVKTTKRKAELTWEFEASENPSTFECRLDDGAFSSCGSPHTEKLRPGAHIFRVRATDPAGNTEFSSEKWHGRVKRKHG